MTESELKSQNFLPEFCQPMSVLSVVVGVELFAIVMSLYGANSFNEFSTDLALSSIFLQWTGLAWAGFLCLFRQKLSQLKALTIGVVAWCLFITITLLMSLAALYLSKDLFGGVVSDLSLLRNSVIAGIVSAMILRYLYISHQWKLQVEAESRAQFDALQARIRPHFLFNSMNTIANLTQTDPNLAEEVIYDLSDLFRASLLNGDRTSTLEDELSLLRGYLRIENQRIGDRMDIIWEMDDLPELVRIPPLLLQPLMENAVYHGIQPAVEKGYIKIKATYEKGLILVSIVNSLPPASDEPKPKGNQIALKNTRQRLKYFFDGRGDFNVTQSVDEYRVDISFPHPWTGA